MSRSEVSQISRFLYHMEGATLICYRHTTPLYRLGRLLRMNSGIMYLITVSHGHSIVREFLR
jgi:hypothetical protein